MVSSTASRVDPVAPTVFAYREDDGGLVWGEYDGDTVEVGRFVGQRRGDLLEISFVHATRDGEVTRGDATSRISVDDGGRLVLTEDFTTPDGQEHVSVCVEVR